MSPPRGGLEEVTERRTPELTPQTPYFQEPQALHCPWGSDPHVRDKGCGPRSQPWLGVVGRHWEDRRPSSPESQGFPECVVQRAPGVTAAPTSEQGTP